jgi:hypothetical protein
MKVFTTLPFFIREPYSALQNATDVEQAKLIQLIFFRSVSFLGKLALLEYLQKEKKSKNINYKLLGFPFPTWAREWTDLLQIIVSHFQEKKKKFVLPLFEITKKYPYFQQIGEDKVSRLLSFSELLENANYLISSADIQECKESLASFLEEFLFLEQCTYEKKEDLVLTLNQESLILWPFFDLRPVEDYSILDNKEDAATALEKAYERWLKPELHSFQKQKKAEINFESILSLHQEKYVFAPWLHTALEEKIENIFTGIQEFHNNALMIGSYPGVGKTALAANWHRWIKNVDCVCSYFIASHTPLQETSTIEKWIMAKLCSFLHLPEIKETDEQSLLFWWIHCREAFEKNYPRIVIGIDGVEILAEQEWIKLMNLIRQDPLNKILFVFFKRLQEPPATNFPCLCLDWQDNFYFEKMFTEDYAQSLKKRYLKTPLSEKIFSHLSQSESFLTAPEIAQAFSMYTPKVLESLIQMKPLLETRLTQNGEQYQIFHPSCKKLLSI